MATVCLHFKFGYCRFRDNCRLNHDDALCDDEQCDITSCSKRHPKVCRYFTFFDRCKFGDYCRYRHLKSRNSYENELLSLKNKLDQMETNFTVLKLQNEQIISNVSNLIQETVVKTTETIFEKLNYHQNKKEELVELQFKALEDQVSKLSRSSSSAAKLTPRPTPTSATLTPNGQGPLSSWNVSANSLKTKGTRLNHVQSLQKPTTSTRADDANSRQTQLQIPDG